MQNIMCNVLTNNIHEPGNIELGTHINIIHVWCSVEDILYRTQRN